MFNQVFIEKDCLDHPRVQGILKNLKEEDPILIDNHEDYFNKVKKPYLQKRTNLNLFIAQKKGTLIKQAPDAYGVASGHHYYFIHTYNCIYECHYCYLQGYFNSPDLVFFVNYEDIGKQIREMSERRNEELWFHAGEFSDSLALSHITGEIPYFFELFKKLPNAKLELRTKSVNIKALLIEDPLDNIITSFSLASKDGVKKSEDKTPPLAARLRAMKQLSDKGHPIGIHLDPIIYSPDFLKEYEELAKEIVKNVPMDRLQYISIGVSSFPSCIFLT